MSRIASTFRRLSKANQVAAIPYLPVGLPDVQTSRLLLPIIGRQGADMIALGTLSAMRSAADGASLSTGATLDDCLNIAAEARRTNEVPLILISLVADAQEYGFEGLSIHSAQAGIDALLILDLSLSDFAVIAPICSAMGVDAIPVISPDIQAATLSQLTLATGFVYCPVSQFSELTKANLKTQVAEATDLPLVIGIDAETLADLPLNTKLADCVLARSGMSEILLSHPEYEVMLEVSDHVRVIQDSIVRAGW